MSSEIDIMRDRVWEALLRRRPGPWAFNAAALAVELGITDRRSRERMRRVLIEYASSPISGLTKYGTVYTYRRS